LAAAFGMDFKNDALTWGTLDYGQTWKNQKPADCWNRYRALSREDAMLMDAETYKCVLPILRKRLCCLRDGNYSEKDAQVELSSVCGALGLNLKEMQSEAVGEKPEPKSWAKLNADGSPKTAAKAPKAKAKKTASKQKAAA
ncbi:hypothetical protein JXA32_12905, partial [Candidatus Sumerlaeota bacterium]|nr:hypothetical protein [Candidatus Sumerlaeota bacterium]